MIQEMSIKLVYVGIVSRKVKARLRELYSRAASGNYEAKLKNPSLQHFIASRTLYICWTAS